MMKVKMSEKRAYRIYYSRDQRRIPNLDDDDHSPIQCSHTSMASAQIKYYTPLTPYLWPQTDHSLRRLEGKCMGEEQRPSETVFERQ